MRDIARSFAAGPFMARYNEAPTKRLAWQTTVHLAIYGLEYICLKEISQAQTK